MKKFLGIMLIIILIAAAVILFMKGMHFGFGNGDGSSGSDSLSSDSVAEITAQTKETIHTTETTATTTATTETTVEIIHFVEVSVVENDYFYQNNRSDLDTLMAELAKLHTNIKVHITDDNASQKAYSALIDALNAAKRDYEEVTDESGTDAATQTTASTQEDDTFTYDGTFDEKVFQHIIKNIVLKDRKISMPCTLADLGEDFSATLLFVKSEDNIALYILSYNDNELGEILYHSNEELSSKQLETTPFFSIYTARSLLDLDFSDFSVAGIIVGDDISRVKEMLGEPTSVNGDEDENDIAYYYKIDDENYVRFFMIDSKVNSISVNIIEI